MVSTLLVSAVEASWLSLALDPREVDSLQNGTFRLLDIAGNLLLCPGKRIGAACHSEIGTGLPLGFEAGANQPFTPPSKGHPTGDEAEPIWESESTGTCRFIDVALTSYAGLELWAGTCG